MLNKPITILPANAALKEEAANKTTTNNSFAHF